MSGNMAGRTVVLTGGSSGIGAAAARALRNRGADVVITGRSPETQRLASEIGCRAYFVDFAKFADVRAFAAQLLADCPRIDVLANNIGGVIKQRQITEDGHEKTLQVNHLSGFLLTMLLRDRLETSGATVINTSSGAHRMGHIDFDDLESERSYSPWRVYGTAKLMNILHAAELNRRFRGINAVSFHPGVVATGFGREGSWIIRRAYEGIIGRVIMIPPERGADTLVWLATSRPGGDWTPGEYYVKRKQATTSREASDPAIAGKLWEASQRMVGM